MYVWTRGYSWGQWGFVKRGEWREHLHTNCWDSSSLFCNSVPKSWTAEYSRLKTGGFFFRKPEKPKKKDPKDTEIGVRQRNNLATNLTCILRLSISLSVSTLGGSSQTVIIRHLRKVLKQNRRKQPGGVSGGREVGNRQHAERRNCQKWYNATIHEMWPGCYLEKWTLRE